MKLLYIDHFAAIEISDKPSSILWSEIKEILLSLVENKKLFCPISFETYLELTKSPFSIAKSRSSFLHEFSNGMSFKQEMPLLYDLICALVRNHKIDREIYLQKSNTSFFQESIEYERLKKFRENYEIDISDKMRDIDFGNQIRRSTSNKEIKIDHAISIQKEILKIQLLERLNLLLSNGTLVIRESNFKFSGRGDWIDKLYYYLITIKGFAHEELLELKNHFESFGIAKVPPLNIKSKLQGYQVYKKLSSTTNDLIDFKRISIGLPESDFLLIDRQRKSEIIELKLDKEYNCKIFSGREKDLKSLKSELLEL